MYLLPILSLPYIFGSLFANSSFYALKDILLLLIVILLLYQKKITINFNSCALALFLLVINIYGFLLSSDYLFYVVSLREFFFFPILGILLASYYRSRMYSMYLSLLVCCLISILYIPFDLSGSFSSTYRLTSFWDREHETGILGGLLFIIAIKNKYKYWKLSVTIGLFLVLLSFSRSVFLALFLIFSFSILKKLNFKKIIIFSTLLFLIFMFFEIFSTRSFDHNITARTSQYSTAYNLILNNNILGIGPDKYGVLGAVVKSYCYDNVCTTTMDSTHLKFLVNYGVFYLILLFVYSILFCKSDSKAVLFFCLFLGIMTGKLSAYPLNLIFYIYIFKELFYCESCLFSKLSQKYRSNKSIGQYS